MKVLNGQEGDIGDLDDIEGNDDDSDVNTLDDTERSVKLMLRSKLFKFIYLFFIKLNNLGGVIPDSTMIHAARKRRQMAREMGVPDEYMSLNTAAENGNGGISNRKSRLVRYEKTSFF
jgi:hypothetical protein